MAQSVTILLKLEPLLRPKCAFFGNSTWSSPMDKVQCTLSIEVDPVM